VQRVEVLGVRGRADQVAQHAVVAPARHQVHVEVRHLLAGGGAGALEQVEPVGPQPSDQQPRDLLDQRRDFVQHVRAPVEQVGDVPGGYDEAVAARQRRDVEERHRRGGRADHERLGLAGDDLAEDARAHGQRT
jgi:hypothetical protein